MDQHFRSYPPCEALSALHKKLFVTNFSLAKRGCWGPERPRKFPKVTWSVGGRAETG